MGAIILSTMVLNIWLWRCAFQIGMLLSDVTVGQYYVYTGSQKLFYPPYPLSSYRLPTYRQPTVAYPVRVVRQIIVIPNLRYIGRKKRTQDPYGTRRRLPTPKNLPERRAISRPRYSRRRRNKSHKKRTKLIKDGQFSVYDGFYIPGGTPIRGKFATGADCRQTCAGRTSCLAADYHRLKRKCYLHTSSTACNAISAKRLIIHYQMAGCDSSDQNGGMEVFPHKYVSGGEKLDETVTLSGCIQSCVRMNDDELSKCFATDYNYESHTCHLHTNWSRVCPVPESEMLIEKPNTVHMVSCS